MNHPTNTADDELIKKLELLTTTYDNPIEEVPTVHEVFDDIKRREQALLEKYDSKQ